MSTSFATLADAMPPELRGDGPPRRPPHTARPSRIPVYNPPPQTHALPPPDGPDRTLALAGNDNTGPTVKKRKARLAEITREQKARAVAIALELRDQGKILPEQAAEVYRRLGFEPSPSALSHWVQDAKNLNSRENIGDDIQSIAQQIGATTEHLRALKRRLKELLDAE